jgi:hypothetical protein
MRALTGHILISIRILGLPSADRMVHCLFPRGERTRQVFPDTLVSLAGVPQVGNVGEEGDLEDDLGGRVRDGGVIKDGAFPRGLGSKVGWVEERMGENFGDLQESDDNRPPSSDSYNLLISIENSRYIFEADLHATSSRSTLLPNPALSSS